MLAARLTPRAPMDLRRKVWRRLLGRTYGWFVARRTARASQTRFFGHPLATHPGVFHPVLYLSTRALADVLLARNLRGCRLLDMGTGSGAIAVVAAAAGAQVTACDINPQAVALAQANLRRNDLGAEVLASDLFSALPGRRFDLVAFNIPFYDQQPTSPLEAAFYGGKDLEVVRRFARACPQHLTAGGAVIIVLSEDCGHDRVVSIFTGAGFVVTGERVTRRFFDKFHTLSLRLASEEARPAARS
jgi:release factor glutamine methyltransferase